MRKGALRLSFPAAVLLCSLCSLHFYVTEADRIPSVMDYQTVETYLRSEFRQGDLLDIHPFWAVRARHYVGDLPHVAARDISTRDLHRCSRLWVASVFGRDRQLEEKLGAKYSLLSENRFGKILLYLYALPQPRQPLYDFYERIHDARVRVDQGKTHKECNTWDDGRWICLPKHEWHFVGQELKDFDGDAERCIWAHPAASGRIVIEYPSVPLGTKIAGRTGITTWGFRYHPKGAPVHLTVSVGGQQIGEIVTPNRMGFFPFEVDTSKFAGQTLAVSFSVSAKSNQGRHFCFHAEAGQ